MREPEVENALNLGVIGGRWQLGAERWELCMGEFSKSVHPRQVQVMSVACELIGAFELSGGKNEIVVIILQLTSDRQALVVAAQNFRNILGTFSVLQIWRPHNWR